MEGADVSRLTDINTFLGNLSGHLVVYSSDEEQQALRDLFRDSENRTDTAEELLTIFPDCGDICSSIADNQYWVAIGAVEAEDGTWSWVTGESPELNDPILDHENVDQQNRGYLVMDGSNTVYVPSYAAGLNHVMLEFDSSLTREELQSQLDSYVATKSKAKGGSKGSCEPIYSSILESKK